MRQIAFDTETTGLEPACGHRIIEIGAVELVDRQMTGNNYHCYINPDRTIDVGAQQVHGIDNDFLTDKPRFSDIMDELMQFIGGAQLIIHNAPFDVGFIDHELALAKHGQKKLADYCSIVDTLSMARQKHPGQKNNLDALCKRYGIDVSQRKLHGALLDAELLARVYLAMTGGQISLFAELNPNALHLNTATASAKRLQRSVTPLPIIQASPAELARHQELLKEHALLNDNCCLWLEESDV